MWLPKSKSLALDHMEGRCCICHFQLFELYPTALLLQNNRSLCLHHRGISDILLGQVYSSKIASTLRFLCETPVIFLIITVILC